MKLTYLFNVLKRIGPKTLLANVRGMKIRRLQNILLKENYDPNAEKLIVFLTPGLDIAQGGILSINSIFEETKKLQSLHQAEVIVCIAPGDKPLLKYTKFENNNYLFDFSQVLAYFKNLKHILIHIPECHIEHFVTNFSYNDHLHLRRIDEVHINIMLQSIEQFSQRDRDAVKKLKLLGKLTCTTAYERDTTPEVRRELGCPIHLLSWYLSPEDYSLRKYGEKEDFMIISPDSKPMKKEILDLIATQLPSLKTQIIENITYEEYKRLISKAKWALTFGEGLDGYFIETVFSGGIGFGVYDPAFFTEDFKDLRTIYSSYELLREKIIEDIKRLNDEKVFVNYWQVEFDLCRKHFSYEEYVNNIRLFYEGKYTVR
jgi:hypothetical protein